MSFWRRYFLMNLRVFHVTLDIRGWYGMRMSSRLHKKKPHLFNFKQLLRLTPPQIGLAYHVRSNFVVCLGVRKRKTFVAVTSLTLAKMQLLLSHMKNFSTRKTVHTVFMLCHWLSSTDFDITFSFSRRFSISSPNSEKRQSHQLKSISISFAYWFRWAELLFSGFGTSLKQKVSTWKKLIKRVNKEEKVSYFMY